MAQKKTGRTRSFKFYDKSLVNELPGFLSSYTQRHIASFAFTGQYKTFRGEFIEGKTYGVATGIGYGHEFVGLGGV